MVKPFIFQIVGYQNSGKTTTATELIARLASQNWDVATIKHHGHGGKPDVIDSKDSSRHISAGAAVSLVEGNGRLLIQAERPMWNIMKKIEILSQFNPDIILIEGHKYELFPKLLLVRSEEDIILLKKLTNILAILCWDNLNLHPTLENGTVPVFSIHQPEVYDDVLKVLVEENIKEGLVQKKDKKI